MKLMSSSRSARTVLGGTLLLGMILAGGCRSHGKVTPEEPATGITASDGSAPSARTTTPVAAAMTEEDRLIKERYERLKQYPCEPFFKEGGKEGCPGCGSQTPTPQTVQYVDRTVDRIVPDPAVVAERDALQAEVNRLKSLPPAPTIPPRDLTVGWEVEPGKGSGVVVKDALTGEVLYRSTACDTAAGKITALANGGAITFQKN